MLGMRSVDALAEALEAGDHEAALGFVTRFRREVLSMIRNYSGWEETLLAWVDREVEGADRSEVLDTIEDFEAAPERAGDGSDPVPRWKEDVQTIAAAIEAGEDNEALVGCYAGDADKVQQTHPFVPAAAGCSSLLQQHREEKEGEEGGRRGTSSQTRSKSRITANSA